MQKVQQPAGEREILDAILAESGARRSVGAGNGTASGSIGLYALLGQAWQRMKARPLPGANRMVDGVHWPPYGRPADEDEEGLGQNSLPRDAKCGRKGAMETQPVAP